MARTNSDAVKALLEPGKHYNGATLLVPAITTASALVDDIVIRAAELGMNLDDSRLELIERYLSAWAYCQSDRTHDSRSTGGSSATFSGKTGMGLDSNLYGQTAKRIDKTGYLVELDAGMGITATGVWLGKTSDEQIPFDDR